MSNLGKEFEELERLLNSDESREKNANTYVYSGDEKRAEIADGKYLRVGDTVWINKTFSGKVACTVDDIRGNIVKISSRSGLDDTYPISTLSSMYRSGDLGSEEFGYDINKGTKEIKTKIFEKGNILNIVTKVSGQYCPSRLLIKKYDPSRDKISAVRIAPVFDVNTEIEFGGSEVYERIVRKMSEIRYQAYVSDKIGSVVDCQEIESGGSRGRVIVTKNIRGEDVVNVQWKTPNREKLSSTEIVEKMAINSKNNGIPAGTVARTMEGYPLVMMFTNKPVKAPTERKQVYYVEFQPMSVKNARSWLEKVYNSDPDAYWGGTSDPNIKFIGKKGIDRMLQRGDLAIIYRMDREELEKNASEIVGGHSSGITRWFFDKGSPWKATDEYIIRDF